MTSTQTDAHGVAGNEDARVLTPDVVIVGAGPAGLSAAACLAPMHDVLVIEREAVPGGVPRHCAHQGFGWRDLRRSLTGPAYAARVAMSAREAGAHLLLSTMVTGWGRDDLSLEATSPQGLVRIEPRAVVLATGARERPRSARLVAGGRPDGVFTTGQLQQLVHLNGRRLEGRAVIVGTELVAWSAVLTLREAGATPALMTTEYPVLEALGVAGALGRAALRVPVVRRARVVEVIGRERVEGVRLRDLDTGVERVEPCGIVVFTGDWIPDHELARSGGVALDGGTRGPAVAADGSTSRDGVFSAGNVVHPVETADVASLGGAHVADRVAAWLSYEREGPALKRSPIRVPIVAGDGVAWVSPNVWTPDSGTAARDRLLFRVTEHHRNARTEIRQAGAVIASHRLPTGAGPGRQLHISWHLLNATNSASGPITVTVT